MLFAPSTVIKSNLKVAVSRRFTIILTRFRIISQLYQASFYKKSVKIESMYVFEFLREELCPSYTAA